MELLCLAVLLGIAATIIGVPLASAVAGWRAREIWGSVLVARRELGDGAFRTVSIEETKPRGVPLLVWVAGVPGAALAPLTGLIVAPAGLLGALIFLDDHESALGLVTLFGAVSGVLLAFALYRASRALLCCEPGARAKARTVSLWSAAHHGIIGAVYATVLAQGVEGAWLAVAPAIAGWVHAAVLLLAGEQVGRIQGSMTDDERAGLERAHAAAQARSVVE